MSNKTKIIRSVRSHDARYLLAKGVGSDAIHSNPEYCMAVTLLETGSAFVGTGITLTLGAGNRVVCDIIELFAPALIGKDIEELMSSFGVFLRSLADHPQLRWLGPHKGAVHLALASIVNACFDLWAKVRGVPLWRLLLDLSPEQIVDLLDLSYLEDVLTATDCLTILRQSIATREQRNFVLQSGYPAYDTSVGWFLYDDAELRMNMDRAIDAGFKAFKMKVGSRDPQRDLRRANVLREVAGEEAHIMLDANQQWSYPEAVKICQELRSVSPYWIEEPTHPDDIMAHHNLAEEIKPMPIAVGEHIPNRVIFKNYMETRSLHFVQVDCTRVAGVSEFIAVSLMARKYKLPVVPHAGDMGQIHQHLVFFNHIAIGHPVEFLEYIPHLKRHFVNPARVVDGTYCLSEDPGSSTDLIELLP